MSDFTPTNTELIEAADKRWQPLLNDQWTLHDDAAQMTDAELACALACRLGYAGKEIHRLMDHRTELERALLLLDALLCPPFGLNRREPQTWDRLEEVRRIVAGVSERREQ